MKLFSGFQLALPGSLPGKPAGENGSFSMKDNNFFSLVIGNRNGNDFGPASTRLLRFENTIIDLTKLAAATFEPGTEGSAAKLRLVLVGAPELVLDGAEATVVWQGLVSRAKAK